MAAVIVLLIVILSNPCLACDVTDIFGKFSPSKTQACIDELESKIFDLKEELFAQHRAMMRLYDRVEALEVDNYIQKNQSKKPK